MSIERLDLFPRLLGESWTRLPSTVKRCHEIEVAMNAHGDFRVSLGQSWMARLMARLMGMPRAGPSVKTRLEVRREGSELIWQRDFAGTRLDSKMYLIDDTRMAERRGPVELCLRISADDSGIDYRSDMTRLCIGHARIRFPKFLSPSVKGRVWADPGSEAMQVHIEIAAPFVGTIITYEGPLELAS